MQAEVAHHGVEGVVGIAHLFAVPDLEAGRRVEQAGEFDHGVSDVDAVDLRAALQCCSGEVAGTAARVE